MNWSSLPSEQRGLLSEDSALPFKNKGEAFSRVMKLSAEGYSYEAITKILAKEEKERYRKLFERERAERLAALEAQVWKGVGLDMRILSCLNALIFVHL